MRAASAAEGQSSGGPRGAAEGGEWVQSSCEQVGALAMGEAGLRPQQTTLPQILRVKGLFSRTPNVRIIKTVSVWESWKSLSEPRRVGGWAMERSSEHRSLCIGWGNPGWAVSAGKVCCVYSPSLVHCSVPQSSVLDLPLFSSYLNHYRHPGVYAAAVERAL